MTVSTAAMVSATQLMGQRVKHICEPEIIGIVTAVEIRIDGGIIYKVAWNKDDASWCLKAELQCV